MFNYVSVDTSYSVAIVIVMAIFVAKIFLVVSACTVFITGRIQLLE